MLQLGGGKECDVVEEVRPASLEASAHWAPGPWGECKVAVEQPATPVPGNKLHLLLPYHAFFKMCTFRNTNIEYNVCLSS